MQEICKIYAKNVQKMYTISRKYAKQRKKYARYAKNMQKNMQKYVRNFARICKEYAN